MHRLFVIKDGIQKELTDIMGNLSWSDNISSLGMKLNFSVQNKYRYVSVGDLVVLLGDNNEVFRGITVKETINKDSTTYSCFDFAFYLNKSKDIYQFNKERADNCIRKLCEDFNVQIKSIASLPTIINKIYNNKVVSEIIKDILDQVKKETGYKYLFEMKEGKFEVYRQDLNIIKATFNLNNTKRNIFDYIANPSRSISIENMKNSIKIVSTDNKKTKLVATARSNNSIKRFGLLQDVKSVDKKDIAQAKNIANNMLKELNKISETNSIELIGNDIVRAGRVIEIKEPETNMKGKYIIKDCTHNVTSGIHTMKLGLEVM